MLVHVIETAAAVKASVPCIVMLASVAVPPFGYGKTDIAGPAYGGFWKIIDVRNRIGHILRSELLPFGIDIFGLEQFAVEHPERGAKAQHLFQKACLERVEIPQILVFHTDSLFSDDAVLVGRDILAAGQAIDEAFALGWNAFNQLLGIIENPR